MYAVDEQVVLYNCIQIFRAGLYSCPGSLGEYQAMIKSKPTAKLIWNKTYWLNRAEEARAIATEIRNPECKRIMVEIAASYDHLATLTDDFQSAAMTPVSHQDVEAKLSKH